MAGLPTVPLCIYKSDIPLKGNDQRCRGLSLSAAELVEARLLLRQAQAAGLVVILKETTSLQSPILLLIFKHIPINFIACLQLATYPIVRLKGYRYEKPLFPLA